MYKKGISLFIFLLLLLPPQSSTALVPMAFWSGCRQARATCLAHYNAGCRQDGVYTLSVSGSELKATCDMTTDGGGWTRLNTALVTSSSPAFNSSDIISGNAVGQSCGGTSNTFTVTGAKISYTKAKLVFTRTTTIMQCPHFPQMTTTAHYYWNNSTWVSHGDTCDWGNTPWAKADPDVTTTGLAYPKWKVLHDGTATTFNFRLGCSYAGDNGAYTAEVYVR